MMRTMTTARFLTTVATITVVIVFMTVAALITIGDLIIRVGFGGHYTIFIIRSPHKSLGSY